jgi:radical SAM superfamily enzyme YgiQ (UPF0313 family)
MDIFFYSITSPEYDKLLEVHNIIKEIYPKSKNIAGGVHVNIFQEDCAKVFDSVCIGDGEDIIVDMVQDVMDNKLQKVYTNPSFGARRTTDMNLYPYPLRKYLPKPAIAHTNLLLGKNSQLVGTGVLFAKGCPFRCAFCAIETYGQQIRQRAPHLVAEEINYLKKEYGVQALALKDDNGIPLNRKIAQPFLESLASCNIKWRGQSRANGIKEDMVKLAAESGCTDLAIGIESADLNVLRTIDKKLDLDEAKRYIEMLRKHGIGPRLLLVAGLPGEGPDIVEKTLRFIEEANPASVVLCLLCPVPGSRITSHPEQFHMKIKPHTWTQIRMNFARFDATEKPRLLFEYDKGMGLSNETILANYEYMQYVLREKKLNF